MAKRSGHGATKPKKKQRMPRPVAPGLVMEAPEDGEERLATAPAGRPVSTIARPTVASAVQAARRAQARPSRATAALPTDYSYVITDLKRIGVLAGAAVIILTALSFVLS